MRRRASLYCHNREHKLLRRVKPRRLTAKQLLCAESLASVQAYDCMLVA
jgi:hypothetical protein